MLSRLALATPLRAQRGTPRAAVNRAQFSTSRPRLAGKYRRFGDPTPQQQRFEGSGSSYSGFRSIPFLRNIRRPPNLVVLGVGGAGGAYYFTHLEKLEIDSSSGWSRYRFLDTSKATERQMGEQSYREVMQEYGRSILPPSHPTSRYVSGVIERILRANPSTQGVDWKVHVVKDDQTKNAFVLPGGQIFVFTGILEPCANADGLAVVLGHEIGHQLLRHSAERLSSMKVLTAISFLLESAGLDIGISRILLNLVMTLPNSRKNESEADFVGLELATAACFDPRAAKSLWKRMDSDGGESGSKGGVNLSFLSTHPASANRAVEVEKWAQKLILDRPSTCQPLKDQIAPFQQASARY